MLKLCRWLTAGCGCPRPPSRELYSCGSLQRQPAGQWQRSTGGREAERQREEETPSTDCSDADGSLTPWYLEVILYQPLT